MLKFQQIIFRKFLTLFIVLFIAVGAIVYLWVKELYINEAKVSLLSNIEIIALSINKTTNLDDLAQDIKERLNTRLTIISEDGDILCESHYDKLTMDNHKYRDEILQSNKRNYGFKIRESKTIKKDLLYVVHCAP